MSIRRSQLKELLNVIIREVITELDYSTGDSMSSDPTVEPDSPIEKEKLERERKKNNRDTLQQQQKVFKFQRDKKQADDKMWKITKKNAEDRIRDLKRSGV
jgi:hypothetical protein